ncbi:MAG TPA: DNA repair protein RecO [Rhodocyclaceae bacterium]|nr:DNA repair protein RecO [Rhodocyclaceae bacterium]
MGERRRVDGQPGFVLHTYPFRETSLIVDVFSRDYGRVALMARGARRPRSALRGLLLGFQPLELGWAGSGEVLTLMKAEWVGGLPLLTDRALFVGYYLNELLINLLPREDDHPKLYDAYVEILHALSQGVQESDLRRFEKVLLQELGYGLSLSHDRNGDPILADRFYRYEIEHGAQLMAVDEAGAAAVRGQTLLDMERGDFSDALSAAQAKQLMRNLMHYYLDGKELETRKIFRELQDL